jgi:glutathionylspermidine synthase
MDRIAVEPRKGWPAIIEEQGLIYWKTDLPDGSMMPYWHESNAYTLTEGEVYEMEGAARVLLEMLVEAGDYIIEENLFSQMGIPGWAVSRIKETWESEPPMVYGRFDFAYPPGETSFKLLEYNADTPTALVETAVQWHWVQDMYGAGGDQWNMVHEQLVGRWKELIHRIPGSRLYFLHTSAEKSGEDFMTAAYMIETARQAGLNCELLPIEQLGYDPERGFVDDQFRPIRAAFKLYPWEWMVHEEFADEALARMGDGHGETTWIEPIWKMLWSNKGILPVLWRLYPDHPNLLPAYFEGEEHKLTSFVRKPLLAREGANSLIVIDGREADRGPDQGYGEEGYVIQQYTELGDYDGNHPVMGVWTVDMEPAGLGIRESTGLVTNNLSRFVPHIIAD